MRTHCCDEMTRQLSEWCPQHADPSACPDALVAYWPKFDEYGLRIHDGGSSIVLISFCPWCGTRLPDSRRNEWFDTLERLGFEDPLTMDIPNEFRSDAWYRDGA